MRIPRWRRLREPFDATTSLTNEAPQVEVEFDRNNARALDASIGTALTAVRAAFGGDTATQFTGPQGLKDVQVIYPQADLRSLGADLGDSDSREQRIDRARRRHHVRSVGAPAPPLIMRIDRRNVVLIGANVAAGRDAF